MILCTSLQILRQIQIGMLVQNLLSKAIKQDYFLQIDTTFKSRSVSHTDMI